MDIARDFLLFIGFAATDSRIDGAADRLGFGDAVIGTADVAGNTLADIAGTAALCFAGPIGIGDEAAADGDEVCLAFGDDLVGYLGIADIAGNDDRFVEFLLYRFRQVGAPGVRQVAFIDLVLDGVVDGGGNVDDVDFRFDVFQEFQCVVQGVSAFDEFVC